MTFLTITINLIIALTLLNVWLIRVNKKTKYRGGDAISMKDEFNQQFMGRWSTICGIDQSSWENHFKGTNKELMEEFQKYEMELGNDTKRNYNSPQDLADLGEYLMYKGTHKSELRKLIYAIDFDSGTAKDLEPYKKLQMRITILEQHIVQVILFLILLNKMFR